MILLSCAKAKTPVRDGALVSRLPSQYRELSVKGGLVVEKYKNWLYK